MIEHCIINHLRYYFGVKSEVFLLDSNSTQYGTNQERTQTALKGGVQLFKKQPDPILVYLFQPLMKMYDIIVKQSFAVIVGFCYNICLFKNPVTTILKVVGYEHWGRKTVSYHNGSLGAKPQSAGKFLQFFVEKNSDFNVIWITFWTGWHVWGPGSEDPSRWANLAIFFGKNSHFNAI